MAPTLMFLVIVPVHVDVVLKEQSPDHPEKTEFASGVAVMVTRVPDANTVPDGLVVTVPDPVPDLVIVRVYPLPDDEALLWVMEKVLPATVKAAVLAAPVFAATEYFTVPLPVPVEPDEIVAQETPVDALQEQPLVAVTEIVPVPPVLAKDALEGEIL